MLTDNDFNHLKLQYERLKKMSIYIRDLINANDWDSVGFAVQEKEILLNSIISFEKSRVEEIKANSELMLMRKNIAFLEQENIELIKTLKQKAIKDLTSIKKAKKVINTYEPTLNNAVSTFDMTDID